MLGVAEVNSIEFSSNGKWFQFGADPLPDQHARALRSFRRAEDVRRRRGHHRDPRDEHAIRARHAGSGGYDTAASAACAHSFATVR
jgi:hypothetical protein